MTNKKLNKLGLYALVSILGFSLIGINCGKGGGKVGLAPDAAQKVYVAPGEKDEVYLFTSGGFSGQVGVHGIPSGRLIKIIPVFSQWAENGYGYEEETKNLLMTSHGFIPWDDSHHPEISMTKGEHDGRWLFINGNNTPRIARISLSSFETEEIIEIPNSAGNHASPFLTWNTEYAMAATRFSVPIPQKDIPIESYSEGKFYGTITMVKIEPQTGHMSIKGQILVPGFNYDLSHCGKNNSADWCFFSMYNTEQAWDVLEIQASKNDKDFILAFNWKKAEQCFDQGKGKKFPGVHYRNYKPHAKPAVSEVRNEVLLMEPKDCPDMMYYLPTPKSPHGVDVDDTGEYIIGGGKLATVIPVHSFSKFIKAKDDPKNYITKIMEIPVLKYESTLHGEVEKPCLGPLHTEFDGKGRAYTSCFVSSEVVQWDIKNLKVLAHLPAYYSIGHLSVVGGDTTKPYGKYLVALNKITKDRYLPTGMELVQSAQLYDISVDPPQLLLDFPTTGEPHYAQMIPASILLKNKVQQIIPLSENDHPYATKSEKDAKVVRNGREVHVYMTAIRSHFKPTKVEVKVGDKVYFHVTNLEQDFDIPHGFAIYGAQLPNILIMPGQTKTVIWEPKKPGVYPFYCTDFCSALHQEMQHYIRVSP